MVDCDHSFAGQLFECVPQRRDWQRVLGCQLAHRRELLTRCQLTRVDGILDRGAGPPPRGARIIRLNR